MTNGVNPMPLLQGAGDNITITNNGTVKTVNGDNVPGIPIDGINAAVINGAVGIIEATGSNSAGISVINGFNAHIERDF